MGARLFSHPRRWIFNERTRYRLVTVFARNNAAVRVFLREKLRCRGSDQTPAAIKLVNFDGT